MPRTPMTVPGPLTIEFGSTTLGVTKTGVVLRIQTHWNPTTDDEHGDMPSDLIYGGKSILVDIVGLSVTLMDTATLFDDLGGVANYDPVVGSGQAKVGALAYGNSLYKALKITERDGSTYWEALCAVPQDPSEIALNATRELQFPTSFIILPDVNEELFSTVPSYVYTP